MKVVIEIDETRFKDVQRIAKVQANYHFKTAEQIIANGVPIEQGMSDCISREAAIQAVTHFKDTLKRLYELPSVEPERKPGEWLKRTDKTKKLYGWYQCSQCGSIIGEPVNYCSECGSYNGGTE